MSDSSQLTPIFVCVHKRFSNAPGCADRGGVDIADALEAGIKARNLQVRIQRMHCLGHCEVGPNVRLGPGGEYIHHVSLDDIEDVLNQIAALGAEN